MKITLLLENQEGKERKTSPWIERREREGEDKSTEQHTQYYERRQHLAPITGPAAKPRVRKRKKKAKEKTLFPRNFRNLCIFGFREHVTSTSRFSWIVVGFLALPILSWLEGFYILFFILDIHILISYLNIIIWVYIQGTEYRVHYVHIVCDYPIP